MNQPTSMAQELLAQLQGMPMQQMAQQLGITPQQTQAAVSTALPLLLGALGKNAEQAQGAAELLQALQKDHAAPVAQAVGGLGGWGGLLGAVLSGVQSASGGASPAANGAAILGHILGSQRPQAEAGLAQATGLGAQAGQLLTMLAPIVMAFLANRVKAGQMDAGTLGSTLQQETVRVQQQGGPLAGVLGSLLDQNGDGKLDVGDLFKLGSSLLGGRK